MPLEIESRRIGRVAVVKCNGRIVAGDESAALHDHVKKLQPEYNQFVLHLGNVQFIDSTGVGLMVRLLCGLRSVRGDLKLCAASDNVSTVLQLTKLSSMFDTHPDEEAALAAFHQQTTLSAPQPRCSGAVLCVEKSSDLLAYLREVLRRAGYEPLTSTNISDATVLLKSAQPRLVILGPGVRSAGAPLESLRRAAASIPLIEIEAEFGTREPAEAAREILAQLEATLQRGGAASA